MSKAREVIAKAIAIYPETFRKVKEAGYEMESLSGFILTCLAQANYEIIYIGTLEESMASMVTATPPGDPP